ncbi:hypothetical protein D3C71_2252920 [compost metagenome]
MKSKHEEGTVQSYFNEAKILNLIGNKFSLVELHLISKENVLEKRHISRYHVVVKKS